MIKIYLETVMCLDGRVDPVSNCPNLKIKGDN